MYILKEIKKKIVVWLSTLRHEGLIEFLIQLLRFIQKNTSRHTAAGTAKQPIYTKASFADIESVDFENIKQFHKKSSKKNLSLAWIMPPPGKGSGGHLNIFRYIQYLEARGHTCSIYLYVDGSRSTIRAVKEIMGDSYPDTMAIDTMSWLDKSNFPTEIDGIFATSWETAYASYTLDSMATRFYFVQDFEPYFYPHGGLYTLAENTYRLGFYGITAGGWLKDKLAAEYGMQTTSCGFGADSALYRYENASRRRGVFCYVRPYTERRGFEIAVLALDIFHKQHPDYAITLVGWDVSSYDIPFPYKNPGVLEINQLSELYNACSAGLVLSFTNMSLLPLELLRCGTIPVVNDAPNNKMVSDNPFIEYADAAPQALAEQLSIAVDKATPGYMHKASESVAEDLWDMSGKTFVDTVEREVIV